MTPVRKHVTLAPSGNINCGIDYASGSLPDAAFCETLTPPESASLAPDASVKVCGASFVANSEPATGQGQVVTINASRWAQDVQNQRAWTVVVASGQPLEVTDGPSC
jgi:hypothetical protein